MVPILAIAFGGLLVVSMISELHFAMSGYKYPPMNGKILFIMALICVGLTGITITAYQLGIKTGQTENAEKFISGR